MAMGVTVDALVVADMQHAFMTGSGAIPDAPRVPESWLRKESTQ